MHDLKLKVGIVFRDNKQLQKNTCPTKGVISTLLKTSMHNSSNKEPIENINFAFTKK